MRKKMKVALSETLQDMVDLGADVKFTTKELNELGVEVPELDMPPSRIQKVRTQMKVSQSVFARLLNVSLSSVRQWEIGVRNPSGTTKALLELLEKNPHLLDFRLNRYVA